jgi:hypothetical protein
MKISNGPPFTRTEYDAALADVNSKLAISLSLLRAVHFRMENEPELYKKIHEFLINLDTSGTVESE